MKKSLIYILTIVFLVVVIGCHKYKKESVGPDIGIASNDFAMIAGFSSSASAVNFKIDPNVFFTAQFNEKVSFTITIKGTTSGASKTIKGLSDKIDLSNSSWEGSSDFIFFKIEPCIAELTILGKEGIVGSVSINVSGTMKGSFIANFENFSLGASIGFWEANERIYSGKSDTAFEGSKGYKMEGIDTKGGGFIGLSYTQPVTNTTAFYTKNGYSNAGPGKVYYNYAGLTQPDSLWFNIFIFGNGDPNAMLYVKFKQDDNGDGTYSDPTENGYEWPITDLSHYGWKLFSINYSALTVSGNQAYGGGGDKTHRPNLIQSIEYALWSKKKNGRVSLVYDYPVFTYGKPFGK